MRYRITLEETSSRLFTREVEAESREAAAAIGHAALDDDSWTEWDESSSDASLAVYDVKAIDAAGREVREPAAAEVRHTSCQHCGQDIEGWTESEDWRDRGNNRSCPDDSGRQHAPTDGGR